MTENQMKVSSLGLLNINKKIADIRKYDKGLIENIGNVHIENNDASEFEEGSYLLKSNLSLTGDKITINLTGLYNPSYSVEREQVAWFLTGESPSNRNAILQFNDNGISLIINSNLVIQFPFLDLTDATPFKAITELSPKSCRLVLYIKGTIYQKTFDFTKDINIETFNKIYLGNDPTDLTEFWRGSLNLAEFTLIENNKVIYTPSTSFPFTFSKVLISDGEVGKLTDETIPVVNHIYQLDLSEITRSNASILFTAQVDKDIRLNIKEIGLYVTTENGEELFSTLKDININKSSNVPYDLIITLNLSINFLNVVGFPDENSFYLEEFKPALLKDFKTVKEVVAYIMTNLERLIILNATNIGYDKAQVFYQLQQEIERNEDCYTNIQSYSKLMKKLKIILEIIFNEDSITPYGNIELTNTGVASNFSNNNYISSSIYVEPDIPWNSTLSFTLLNNVAQGERETLATYVGTKVVVRDPYLSSWRYSNTTLASKTLLFNYIGSDWTNTIHVPYVDGKGIINDWYNSSTSGTTDTNRNTPFYNNQNVISVNLQYTPFRNNSMNYAFYNCRNLTSVVEIPNNVTSMVQTFCYCPNFNETINIPKTVITMTRAFENCTTLNKPINLPDSTTTINMHSAFSNCINFNQPITIPYNTQGSLDNTFRNCRKFNQPINLNYQSKITSMNSSFYSCVELNQPLNIPETVNNIDYCFYSCSNLNSPISIGSNVKSATSSFAWCEKLNSPINFNLSNKLVNMDYTFYNCTNFNQPITIPNSVINMIGTFLNCNNFNSKVTMGRNVINMSNTFLNCKLFNKDIDIPDSVTNMYYTFSGCYNRNSYININSTSNVINMKGTFSRCVDLNVPITIGDKVKDLSEAFFFCRSFNSPITIGSNVKNMVNTFYNCSNFNQPIIIPDQVTNLHNTFYNCKSFNQPISLGNNIVNMERAFYECEAFNQPVKIADSVKDLESTFYNCISLNQPIIIGNNITDMESTFYNCKSFNQNITIGTNVTYFDNAFRNCSKFNGTITFLGNNINEMWYSFYNCQEFNQPINIPDSVVNANYIFYLCTNLNSTVTLSNNSKYLESAFSSCYNFNKNITIPKSVISLRGAFDYCNNFKSTVNIESTELTGTYKIFHNTSLPKQIQIYFNYANGITTNTFMSFRSSGYIYANGQSTGNNGVTIINKGLAPW